jgi:citronellol/citronellal dehydrogenase
MGKLDGKVAIVTGSASGIGKTIAKTLAAEGAKVACADLWLGDCKNTREGTMVPSLSQVQPRQVRSANLTDIVSEIQKAGNTAVGIQTDLTSEDSCDQLLWNTKRLLGPVDVLVNNAVLTYFLSILEFPVEWWRRCFDVNIHAPFIMAKKVLPSMMDRRTGAIINIGSEAAVGPGRGPYGKYPVTRTVIGPNTMYATTKAAVERFTQGLAEEVYRYGITVASVAPANTVKTEGGDYLKIQHPQNEPPEMMARAILLLATEPLDKVTGRVAYSQALLKEFGWISEAKGVGTDYKGTGYSQI